jgi:biotin carboxyl carrier protein
MRQVEVTLAGRQHVVEFTSLNHTPLEVRVDGEAYLVELDGLHTNSPHVRSVRLKPITKTLQLSTQSDNPKEVRAPMVGKVVRLYVEIGQMVNTGDPLCIIEAMKMEQTISCAHSGVIKELLVESGWVLTQGDLILTLE